MKLKKQIILFCLILVIQMTSDNLFCQITQTKPTRQSSFEAFSQGNYEKAYSEFRELLLTYAKDPLYKYYSGVCLVKLNREPGEAVNLLQQALQEGGAVKTLPADGLFYLARAQQMLGKYSDATESYNYYTNKVGKKVAKEMGVPEFLKQCEQRQGQVAQSELKPSDNFKDNKVDSSKVTATAKTMEPIQNPVEKSIYKKENPSVSYEKILSEAIEFQFKADSVSAIISQQKKKIENLSGTEKISLKLRINENEKSAASLQASADLKYHEAQLAMNPDQDTMIPAKKPVLQDTLMSHNKSIGQTEFKGPEDTAKSTDNKAIKIPEKQADIHKNILPPVMPQMEVFSFFDVSGKTAAEQNSKIIIDPEVPPGLIYRIQLAVFRNPVAPGYFKGLNPVYGFKIEGTDKIGYYAGMFRKSIDAGKALAAVKAKGFKDAFVIALSDSKRVSTDRAALLEKEWGGKPFYSISRISTDKQADTLTPTLTFRVEVTRSLKPLTEDIVEGIRKMAGNRGLDILLLEDGKIDYLIGKFITFETASEYSDLLKRNGYRDTQVVAWLGKKEIPIETARQLFEKLK